MPSDVLIAGAGQLGSRYLQGLARVARPLSVYVQDVSAESLSRAEARWRDVVGEDARHRVVFTETFSDLPEATDIAIVATTADVRPSVVEHVSRKTDVRFWVLEKVLAQSQKGLSKLGAAVRGSDGTWVNTPRRMIEWHKQIKSELNGSSPIELTVTGGMWGLACNTVHFLDLLQWWTGEELLQIDTTGLDPKWIESKRAGNWEVLGSLDASFAGGSVAKVEAVDNTLPTRLGIRAESCSWTIDESSGTATRVDGREILGRLSLQSELTSHLVESLLQTGRCELPTLDEATAVHQVFLESMLAHWRTHMDPEAVSVPIT